MTDILDRLQELVADRVGLGPTENSKIFPVLIDAIHEIARLRADIADGDLRWVKICEKYLYEIANLEKIIADSADMLDSQAAGIDKSLTLPT